MERLRDWALKLIIALNVIALVVSFGESFAGLFQWAHHHSITGFSGAVWPLMIDVIVLVGESGLFVAHKDHWRVQDKIWLWFITLVALGVSTAANVGHVVSTDWLTHLTASLPPVALFFSMTVGFGVMKRVYLNKPRASQPAGERVPEPVLSDEWRAVGRTPPERSQPPLIFPPTQPLTENVSPPETPESERPAPAIPDSLSATETFAAPEFRVIPGKSFTMPQDTRKELKLPEQRTRDMYDVDPDISVNAVATALGCAWQTAKNYLDATKKARGLPV